MHVNRISIFYAWPTDQNSGFVNLFKFNVNFLANDKLEMKFETLLLIVEGK